MSKREREKGKRGELEVAKRFRAHGFDCDRVPNSGGLRLRGDLYGELPLEIEVKRQETYALERWIKQASGEFAGKPWALVFRKTHSPWYALLELELVLALLEAVLVLQDRLDDIAAVSYTPNESPEFAAWASHERWWEVDRG